MGQGWPYLQARGGEEDVEVERKRVENERRPRCSPYQDLFASPPSGERGWARTAGRRGGEGTGHGGAYLRVIPEGRTPSAWDPADNVPSRFALYPRPILGVEVVELTARSDATLPLRMLKSRGWMELGTLKGVLA